MRSLRTRLAPFSPALIVFLACGSLRATEQALAEPAKPKQQTTSDYVFHRRLDGETTLRMFAEIREWIWGHFKERRPGRLVVTMYSLEGDRTTTTYVVERDDADVWSISVRIDRKLVRRGPPFDRWREAQEFAAYLVDRVECRMELVGRGHPYPTEEMKRRQPFYQYCVVLKDQNGKELQRF